MLQKIHDLAKGWLAYLIVALLIIPFALWGIHEYFGTGGDRVVAIVNGTEISAQELRNAVQQQRERLRDMFGGRLPAQLADDALLNDAALNELIRLELLRQEADRAGFRVSDELLLDQIRQIEAFQENGQFSASRYEQLLSMQRRSKAGFEAELREGIRLSQLEGGVAATTFVTGEEVRDFERLNGQTRKISYFIVEPGRFSDQIEPTDEQLQAYYEDHADLFRQPERAKLAYVELSLPEMARGISVSEDDLQALYEEQIDRYTVSEQRRASHILFSLSRDESDAEVAEAEQKARDLLERLRAGEDFSELAKEYSNDSLSADRGGDLGVIREGEQPPALEAVVDELDLGEVSEPIRTEFGFHLVKLTGLEPGRTQDFAEVRGELETQYRQHEAERLFIDYADELATVSYEIADSLEAAADAIGGSVKTTDWITRDSGEGVANDPRVREAAFSVEVLEDGRNSDLIELSDGQAVVVRVLEHEPASRRPFAEVRSEVEAAFVEESARREAVDLGQSLLAELRDGADLESVVAESGLELHMPGFLARDDGSIPSEIVGEAFSLPRPEAGKSVYGGLETGAGGYAVVAISGVEEQIPNTAAEADRAQIRADYSRREEQAFFNALRERAEVRILREEP